MSKVVLLCAVLAWTRAARADDAAPVGELLAQPAQLAQWLRDRDPIASSSRAKIEAARAVSRQARVLPNPQLELGVSDFVLGRTNATDGGPGSANPSLGLGKTLIFTAGLQQLVELGKRGPRREAADLRGQEAEASAAGALGGRIGDATQALGKLAYVAARKTVVATNLAAARQLMALEQVRVDHADLSALDFARIELDTEAIELQLGRADADVAVATATCSATLFAPCTASGLDDPGVLDHGAPLPAALPEAQEAITTAIEARPQRRAAQLEVDALGQDAQLAHARRIPDPTLGVGYTLDNLTVSGDQHQSLMFTVGIPLPIFDRGTHDEAAARANARAAAEEERAEVRTARGTVDALLAQRATLEATLQKLERDAVPKSAQIIAQTQKAFDLGQTPLSDLLLVERAHRDLLLEVLDTRFDLFTVRATLRQQLGLDDLAAQGREGTP